jgi:hypothetical protein
VDLKLSLSQDTIVCFDALESVPLNIFQSTILANVGVKNFYKIKVSNKF